MQIVNRTARRLRASARRFASDVRGNVAMIFALVLPVLLLVGLGGIDIHRASGVRMNLQDALDAATLAAARSSYTAAEDLTRVGQAALQANLAPYDRISLASSSFRLTEDQKVIGDATVNVTAIAAHIFLPPYGQLFDAQLPVDAHTEVNRSSKNIEVGLVLDITGSMAEGTRLQDLKAAATQLVDIVVQPTQSPYTTRMAIIPYSVGVNMGSYVNAARGAPIGAKAIRGASWATSGSSNVNINNITRASPGVVTTANSHGLVTGEYIWISGVSGMTQINNRPYRVTRISNTTFSLQSWNGSSWAAVNTTSGNGYSAYSSSATDVLRECQVSDCGIVISSTQHDIPATTTDTGTTRPGTVYITGIVGLTELNNRGFEIANVTNNSFSLVGSQGPLLTNVYVSGGSAWCGQDGCQWRVFRRASDSAITAVETSSCVSERTGSQAYTEASPSTAFVGRNYAAANNPCPPSSAAIMPLSSSISSLKSKISGLTVTGSTAGQIGLAWGWYTISPNFNALWSGNAALPYNERDTIKAVIMMTDGDFNSPYCTGVLAQDAGNGSGSSNDKINCDATNGDPFTQATAMCTAMKARGVWIYTVGFQVTANSQAARILADCATSSEHAFLPASGSDLTENFAAIGRDITRLRISR